VKGGKKNKKKVDQEGFGLFHIKRSATEKSKGVEVNWYLREELFRCPKWTYSWPLHDKERNYLARKRLSIKKGTEKTERNCCGRQLRRDCCSDEGKK